MHHSFSSLFVSSLALKFMYRHINTGLEKNLWRKLKWEHAIIDWYFNGLFIRCDDWRVVVLVYYWEDVDLLNVFFQIQIELRPLLLTLICTSMYLLPETYFMWMTLIGCDKVQLTLFSTTKVESQNRDEANEKVSCCSGGGGNERHA